MFVNRERELATLRSWWRASSSRLAIVWGRRRVGKTALVRQFAPARSVFHTGAGRSERDELTLLARNVAALDARAGTRDLLARPYTDWDDALDHLADVANRQPLLLVLDEYPELASTTPSLPNRLRAFLDRSTDRTKLRVLLCGSAVRPMQALSEERQPLFGRADVLLAIHPFAPWEAALMLPKLSPAERAVVFGLVGGVPLYLSWWNESGSVRENLRRLACEPGARLLVEGDLVLATEAEAGEYPSAVLHAIAGGATRHNEIASAVGADPTRTLDRLVAVQLVERLLPVTEGPRTRRRAYRIADNFLRFHLGVLSRYRTEIDGGLGPAILPVIVDSLDDHLGLAWEAAFRALLVRLAAAGDLGGDIVAVGPWWSTDGRAEIDAVALAGRSRTPVLAGEAKWAKTVNGGRLARDLHRRALLVPGMSSDATLMLAARERVSEPPTDVRVVTANDIFG